MDASRPGRPVSGRLLSRLGTLPETVVVAMRALEDLALALAVFVVTADQGGGGVEEFGVFGGPSEPAQTLIAVGAALPVLLRRRTLYPLLVVGAAVWAAVGAPWGLMVGAYTLSARSRRPYWYGAFVGALAVLVLVRFLVGTDAAVRYAVLLTVLVAGTPVLLGLWVGARRALLAALRERAERLEREHQVMAEQAKAQERARIAREMHDVVAHRVSLMVLHAGALESTLADPAAARQAGTIRQTGREALTELRQVLSVLREQDQAGALEPQPTLADLDGMVRRSRDAGMRVEVVVDGDRRSLPATVERTSYRLVQEALTNAHKHAGGAATEVRLCYRPDRLEVSVRNARPPDGRVPRPVLPGGGHGLVGLRERVELLGGSFHAGPRLDGGYELRASMPVEVPA
jgi:signal transduction histidine kinase